MACDTAPFAGISDPGRGGVGSAPIADAEAMPFNGLTRGTDVGIDGIIGGDATSGVVNDSVMRGSIRCPCVFH